MGTADSGHGFTSIFYKWIFPLLLLFFSLGLQVAESMSCYAAAQLSCYQNLTDLIVLIQEKNKTPNERFNICRAFYAVQDCFVPHLTLCEQRERQMFSQDVVTYLSKPPYNCQNQSFEVFMKDVPLPGGASHQQGLQPLYLSLILFLLHSVINLVVTKQLR